MDEILNTPQLHQAINSSLVASWSETSSDPIEDIKDYAELLKNKATYGPVEFIVSPAMKDRLEALLIGTTTGTINVSGFFDKDIPPPATPEPKPIKGRSIRR